MSTHEDVLAVVRQRPVTETRPDIAKTAGDAVLRAVASLDRASQVAVLEWALTQVEGRARPEQKRADCHPVTRGDRDEQLLQWKRDGLTDQAIAARFGCDRNVVNARKLVLRRMGQ